MTRLLFQRKPFFTNKQLDRLSNILDGTGQVLLGMVVIGPLFNTKQINIFILIFGMILIIGVWAASIFVIKRGDIYGY